MALHELAVTELDAVCGGRSRHDGHGGYSKPSIDVEVNLVGVKQVQANTTSVFLSKKVDASNNQAVIIGSIG